MKNRVLSFQFAIFFIVATLLSSVAAVVFDHGFYTDLYEEIHLSQTTGVSDEELQDSIFMMTDYVEGKRDNLDGRVVWKGKEQETFNAKEKKHMVDVRTLWLRARLVMIISWVAAILSALVVLVREKEKGFALLYAGFKQAMFCLLILFGFFGFWYLTDFTSLWTWFHTVFFAGNMDWLLNPATDFMIVICPEQMFSTMIASIALKFVLALGASGIALSFLAKSGSHMSYLRAIGRKSDAAGFSKDNAREDSSSAHSNC